MKWFVLLRKHQENMLLLDLAKDCKIGDGSSYGSGTVKGDRNGHDLVLMGMENDEVPDVDGGIIATLLTQQSPSI
jgi:hypothetical protein